MSDDIKNMLEEGAKRFAALEGNLETTQNRLKDLEQLRERLGGSWSKDDSKRSFSFAAVLRGMASGGLDAAGAWKGAEKEREAGVAARERALSVGTDSAGGYIVPEEYMAEIIELLRAKVVAIQAGATQLNGLQGSPVKMPRLDTAVTAQWQNGENTSITASDQAFGEVSMSPKMATALTKMSRRLVSLSNPSVEAVVRADLVATIARLVDLAAFRGTGSNGQPTGIANTASIGTITSVGAIEIEDIYNALYELEKSNAPMNRVGLVCHPRTWNQLRKLRAGGSTTGDGAFLLNPDPAVAVRGTIAGYPVYTTTQIPITLGGGTDTVAYFGDFSELLIGQWGTMTLEATDSGGDAFQYHQMWVKAVMEMDIAVRHAKSFVELSGITA